MKKLKTSTLMFIGVGCLLLLGALLFVSPLVTVAAVAPTVLLSVIFHEGLGRKIDDEFPVDKSLLTDRDQPDAEAEKPVRNYRGRSSLRAVNRWFEPKGELVDHSRVQLPPLPSVPQEHQAMVQEYLQAGLALGRALNDAIPDQELAVHPGTFGRFERIEPQFAAHYRTLNPVQFRQLADGTTVASEIGALIQPLVEGETTYQYAAGLRQQFFRRKAS
jgi:hypothetical protein